VSENFDIKSIDLEIKDDGKGEVAAVFSVFDKVDSDGDIVKSGSIKSGFKSGDVPMVWAHKWDMPIGKGQIIQDDDKATFKGEFFMDTESGKEAYNLVKAMGDLQQWSFGFKVDDSEYGKIQKDGSDDEESVRYLKGLTVYEVSPVLVGANQETYTMAIKSNNELVEQIAEAKAVMTTGSMNQPDPEEEAPAEEIPAEEAPVEEAPAEEAEVEEAPAEENSEEEIEIDTEFEEVEEEKELKVSEEVTKTFSEEVKDVLAALDDLITRAKAISHLRQKDGRKLGAKATEALRTVQDDLSDAWAELDSFVDEFGNEAVLESEVEEQPTDDSETDENNGVVEEAINDEVEEEILDDNSSEEEETEETPVSEVSEESEDNSESTDEDFDAEWVEGQRLIAETVDIEV
jgi:HK97 family phage prohead protease